MIPSKSLLHIRQSLPWTAFMRTKKSNLLPFKFSLREKRSDRWGVRKCPYRRTYNNDVIVLRIFVSSLQFGFYFHHGLLPSSHIFHKSLGLQILYGFQFEHISFELMSYGFGHESGASFKGIIDDENLFMH